MLERVALFSNLNQQQIEELEAIAQPRNIPRNTVVISEGEQSDALYILLSGRAYAVRNDESGRQFVINRFGPNDYFGEMSFFDGQSRCATVVTKEPCRILVIPRQAFLDFTEKDPQILINVTQVLLEKLRKATQQIEELALRDVFSRLARFLSENMGPNGVLRERFTHQELADIVGSTRETICRILNELTEDGYLGRKGSRITVKKKLPYKF